MLPRIREILIGLTNLKQRLTNKVYDSVLELINMEFFAINVVHFLKLADSILAAVLCFLLLSFLSQVLSNPPKFLAARNVLKQRF